MNIGSMISWIRSKSFQVRIHVTAAIPAPAKPKPMTTAGREREKGPRRLDEPEQAMTTRYAAE